MKLTKNTNRSSICLLAGIFALLVLAMGLVPYAHAQAGTADVLGTITDQTGAVIPGAQITLTNTGTGIVKKGTSDAKGEYIFTALQNGTYSIDVEMQGFKSHTNKSFAVSTGERVRMDAAMQPGAVSEKIVVTTELAQLQTDSSSVTASIAPQAMQDLPTANRNFYSLAQVLPGISVGGQSGSTGAGTATSGSTEFDRRPASTVVANGQSDSGNNNLVNGFDNNEVAYGNTSVRPTIDGIEEMKVISTNAPAEFGRAAGAVINVITKSGTNRFRGSLFEFLRNQKTDARNYFDNTGTKAAYHQNNFGGSLGGPIIKDRTFFFFGIEKDMINRGLTFNWNVPTTYEYNQLNQNSVFDYTDHCVDSNGNQLPDTLGVGCASSATGAWPAPMPLSPANQGLAFIRKMFLLYPAPNENPTDINHAAFSYSPPYTQRILDWELRIDHNFTPNDKMFIRYAYNPAKSVYPSEFPAVSNALWGNVPVYGIANPWGQVGIGSQNTDNIQGDYVHTVNSNFVLDFKVGETRYASSSVGPNTYRGLAAAMGMPNAAAPGQLGDDLPLIGGPTFPYGPVGGPNEQPFHNVENAYMYGASATYIRGSHEIKAGGGMIRRHAFVDQTHQAAGFIFCGDVISCLSGQTVFAERQSPSYDNNYRGREWDAFAQDNWRVNSKLTLNLGVRYDVFYPYSELHGYSSNFLVSTLGDNLTQDAHNFVLGGKGGIQTDYTAFAPRLGFAYMWRKNTVIRGGFGMTYLPYSSGGGAGTSNIGAGSNNPPFNYYYHQNGADLSDVSGGANDFWVHNVQPTDITTWGNNSAVSVLTATPLNAKNSRYFQATLGVQHQMGPNAFTVQYVGVFARNRGTGIDLDKPDMPGAGATSAAPYIYTNSTAISPVFANPTGVLNYVVTLSSTKFTGLSNYNGMQAIYERRLSNGLNVSANYTLAHSLATINGAGTGGTGNPNNSDLFYGNSGNDIRNRIAGTISYELPFGKSAHGVLAQIIKGWQTNAVVQWQTGSAFGFSAGGSCTYASYPGGGPGNPQGEPTIIDSRCPSNVQSPPPGPPGMPGVTLGSGTGYTLQAGQNYYYPNRVAGKKFFKHGPNVFASNAATELDYSALEPPTPGTDGNLGINPFYGPHFRNADMSIFKTFQLMEGYGLQFRAEVFNVTNTPNFVQSSNNTIGGWNGSDSTGFSASPQANFGTITDTAGFSVPRQFQFALKLLF
jgi:hypothetical protein